MLPLNSSINSLSDILYILSILTISLLPHCLEASRDILFNLSTFFILSFSSNFTTQFLDKNGITLSEPISTAFEPQNPFYPT